MGPWHRRHRGMRLFLRHSVQEHRGTILGFFANAPGSSSRSKLDLLVQPCPAHRPVTFHSAGRYLEDFRDFLNRQATKESQLDDSALLRVQTLEVLESAIEQKQIDFSPLCETGCLVQTKFRYGRGA